MIRIVLADPQELVREGIKVLFEKISGISVVSTTSVVSETVAYVKDASGASCDVVVLDPYMPGRGGLELIRRIKTAAPALPVLILTSRNEPGFACSAIKAGASGYLSKEGPFSELLHAVRTVASGRPYISVGVAEQLVLDLSRQLDPSGHETLSDREQQVLELLLQGNSITSTARQLHLSAKTISTHKSRIMEKMKVSSFAEMVQYGIAHNLYGSFRDSRLGEAQYVLTER